MALTISPEAGALVRFGLLGELGDTAGAINEAVGRAGYDEAAAWYTGPLKRQDAARALLDVVGWENVKKPRPVTVYLDAHRYALRRAIRNSLDQQIMVAGDTDTPSERRATAEANRALLEKLIATIEGQVTAEHDAKLIALGRAIRRLRQDRHLSIRALARKAGMSTGHLGVIERGRSNPRLETLYALTDALGIMHAELFLAAEAEAADGGEA